MENSQFSSIIFHPTISFLEGHIASIYGKSHLNESESPSGNGGKKGNNEPLRSGI